MGESEGKHTRCSMPWPLLVVLNSLVYNLVSGTPAAALSPLRADDDASADADAPVGSRPMQLSVHEGSPPAGDEGGAG